MAEDVALATTDNVNNFHSVVLASDIEIRDEAKREIGIRIVPWNVVAETMDGPEVFVRGAFDGIDPRKVVLRMDHENPPAGRGLSLEDEDDGAYMAFRVSKTQRGDEILALASDGVSTGASVGYMRTGSVVDLMSVDGKRTRVVRKAALREVSTTWTPTWDEAAITYVRATDLVAPTPEVPEGEPTVSDAAPVEVTPAPPVVDLAPLTEAISGQSAVMQRSLEVFAERLEKVEERDRKDIIIPRAIEEVNLRAKRGDWMQAVLTMLSGQRVNEMQMRALDDLITSDNVGVVPDAFSSEIIGIIDATRPFLSTTRRLDLPAAGMSLVVPKIVTRPETGVQTTYDHTGASNPPEKSELASNTTSITTETFDAVTIGGAGDISLQLLKRSSPSFLSLYLELLAESLAKNAEIEALQALLAAGVTSGGALDVEDTSFGDAWVAGANAGITPDTIWLSTEAVGAFIDAKADGTNMPLYSTIQAGFNAGNGAAGTISGLRPVHVPQLDSASTTVDVIIGPSRGFGWTEDGAYTLQVDVPAKAGRDVALVSILWFAPMYPSAFTTYTIAS